MTRHASEQNNFTESHFLKKGEMKIFFLCCIIAINPIALQRLVLHKYLDITCSTESLQNNEMKNHFGINYFWPSLLGL